MKAYQVHEYSSDAKFVPAEVEQPQLKPGHVLIEVKATSLNPVDNKLLVEDIGLNLPLPAILHMDVAGVVSAVADDVTGFAIGDEVYGCAGGLQGMVGPIDGALADFMLADADLIAHKPKSLDFAESAALPLVSITAWEALHDRIELQKGEHVLIHAATGGVGHLAIQLAKQIGATVATTVSGEDKATIARDLGADEIINYREETVADYVQRLTDGAGFDAVFDTVGGPNLDKSFEATRASGQVASVIGMNTHDLTPMHVKGLSLHIVFMLLQMITGNNRSHHQYILSQVSKLVDEGAVKPLIHSEGFTFEQANEAHVLFASNKHLGKIVLMNE